MPAPTRRTLLGAGLASVSVAAGLTACDAEAPAADPTPTPSPTGSATAATDSAAATAPTIPDFDETDWESVRAQFPLDPAMAQFAAFVLSPHTAQVDAAIDFHRGRLALDTEGTLLEGFDLENAVRRAAADHSGGTPGQYALTDSTTMGIATMYGGLALSADDEVLSTTHDFFSTEDSLRLLTKRTGAHGQAGHALRPAVAGDRRRDGPPTGRRAHPAHEGRGRDLGALLDRGAAPVKEIASAEAIEQATGRGPALRRRRARLRGGRRRPARPRLRLPVRRHPQVAVRPRGTGILWGRDWDPLTELIPSFSGPDEGARLSPGGYHAFEHRWALDQGFAFHQKVGRAAAVQRTVEQASQLKEGLAGAKGIRVVTPADPEVSAGIVCLDVEGLPPGNGVYELRQQGIVASATPYQKSYLRLGPSIVTTPEQVDAAVEAVAGLV